MVAVVLFVLVFVLVLVLFVIGSLVVVFVVIVTPAASGSRHRINAPFQPSSFGAVSSVYRYLYHANGGGYAEAGRRTWWQSPGRLCSGGSHRRSAARVYPKRA